MSLLKLTAATKSVNKHRLSARTSLLHATINITAICGLSSAASRSAVELASNVWFFDVTRAGKKPRFLEKVFRFLVFFRFLKVFSILVYKDNRTKICDPGRTS